MLLGVLLIGLILFGQDVAGMVTSRGRLDPTLAHPDGPRTVIVVLSFTPERFHNERLATYGVFAGRDKSVNRIRLRQVTPENLARLGNLAWVARVEPGR